ncbi:MAG: hypothetical protein KDB61_01045, partial [Planctomycetes bacterium]|nr:hypothetical protein [Planctomycetota bacterium]
MSRSAKASNPAKDRRSEEESGWLGPDAWLAILCALPLFALALLPVLVGVPSTESAGPGWVLPLFLP